MSTQSSDETGRIKSISAKTAYSRAAQKKLADTRIRLAGVSAKIRNAVAAERLQASDQLRNAQNAVDANLAATEALLEQVRKSSEDSWEDLKGDVDTAWEDLSRSVKKLVAIFSDGTNS